MSSSHQVRSTTASLLLGIAALVVVLPSAALWGTPLPATFGSVDRSAASASMLHEPSARAVAAPVSVSATAAPSAPDTGAASQFTAEDAPVLSTEAWQSLFPLLVVLTVVVGLWSAVPLRVPGRWREQAGRPVGVEVHAACGRRAPPSLL